MSSLSSCQTLHIFSSSICSFFKLTITSKLGCTPYKICNIYFFSYTVNMTVNTRLTSFKHLFIINKINLIDQELTILSCNTLLDKLHKVHTLSCSSFCLSLNFHTWPIFHLVLHHPYPYTLLLYPLQSVGQPPTITYQFLEKQFRIFVNYEFLDPPGNSVNILGQISFSPINTYIIQGRKVLQTLDLSRVKFSCP